MKKFILLSMVVFSLGALNEVAYGKPGNGKAKGHDKVERPEKGNLQDEKLNWGQLKDNLKDSEGNYIEEVLEEIFGEKYDENKNYTFEDIKVAFTNNPVNQKALDAHQNWGQLKKYLKDEDGYIQSELEAFFGLKTGTLNDEDMALFSDKLVKEAIKGERNIRRELRRYKGDLPPLPVDAAIVSTDDLLEDWVNYYLYGDDENIRSIFEKWPVEDSDQPEFSLKSLDKMDRAVVKFEVALERLNNE